MPDLIRWGAIELEKLKGDVDKLVDALCRDFGAGERACRETGLRVTRTDGEWVVTCPGIRLEDVTVSVKDGILTIRLTRLALNHGSLK